MLIHAISQHQNQDYNLIQIYDKDNGQIYDIDDTFYDTVMILNNVWPGKIGMITSSTQPESGKSL